MRALWICQPRRDELLWSRQDCWAQGQAGRGHIVVLSEEAGIGKSRLVQVVQDEIIGAATLRIDYRLLAGGP